MILQLYNLARYRLLQDIDVAETAEASIAPCVNHAVCCDGTRVTVPCFDPQRHLTVFMRLKGAWIELVWNLNVLVAYR